MPQPQVIALHGLLGFHQAALQCRQSLHVAAQRQKPPVRFKLDQCVLHGDIDALRRGVVHMAPTQIGAIRGRRQHVPHLALAV